MDDIVVLWFALIASVLGSGIPGFVLGYFDWPKEIGARVVAVLLIPLIAASLATSLLFSSSPAMFNTAVAFMGLWAVALFSLFAFIVAGGDAYKKSRHYKPYYKQFEL